MQLCVDVLFSLCKWLPVPLLSQGLNEWWGCGKVRITAVWFWLLGCKVTGILKTQALPASSGSRRTDHLTLGSYWMHIKVDFYLNIH